MIGAVDVARLGACWLVAVAACGRLDFDDLGPCQGAFGPPRLESELHVDGIDTWAPTLTADRLDIMFTRGGRCRYATGSCGAASPTGTIWEATRASVDEPFGAPVEHGELGIEMNRYRPSMLGDGLTVYLAGYPGTNNNGQIYMATRPARAMAWSSPAEVTVCSTGTTDLYGADVTDDNLEMYVDQCIGVPQNCPMQHGVWDSAAQRFDCTGIRSEVGIDLGSASAYMEEWPSLSGDRLTLYYVIKTGNGTPIQTAIWTAQRATTSDPLANPTELMWTVVDGADLDTPSITRDDQQLWFASDRAKPGGPRDLYVATRTCGP